MKLIIAIAEETPELFGPTNSLMMEVPEGVNPDELFVETTRAAFAEIVTQELRPKDPAQ